MSSVVVVPVDSSDFKISLSCHYCKFASVHVRLWVFRVICVLHFTCFCSFAVYEKYRSFFGRWKMVKKSINLIVSSEQVSLSCLLDIPPKYTRTEDNYLTREIQIWLMIWNSAWNCKVVTKFLPRLCVMTPTFSLHHLAAACSPASLDTACHSLAQPRPPVRPCFPSPLLLFGSQLADCSLYYTILWVWN